MKIERSFFRQNVPRSWAFSVVLILSFLLAWYTVTTGEKIAKEFKESEIFDASKRIKKSGLDGSEEKTAEKKRDF